MAKARVDKRVLIDMIVDDFDDLPIAKELLWVGKDAIWRHLNKKYKKSELEEIFYG